MASKNINAEKIQGNLSINGITGTTINVNGQYELPTTFGSSGDVLTLSGTNQTVWQAPTGGSSVFTIDSGDNLFGGTQSGTQLTGSSGQRCFFGGYRAGYLVTSGKYNVAIGERALSNAATTGQSNVAIGSNTSKNITTGSYNVSLGLESGNDISTGNYNVMIGFQAGRGSNGNRNTIIGGFYTGTNSGDDNTIIGANATSTSVYADKNIVIGRCVPDLATGNVAIGYNVQQNGDVTGNGNIFIHPSHAAMSNYNAVSGSDNCVIGLDVEVPTGLSNYVSLYNIYRGDHSAGECYMACPSTAAADADLNNSEVHLSVDETGNNLQIKVKYSSGTVKTATVALT